MDKITSVFDVAARAMSSQMTRLNTVASNLANANSVGSSPEDTSRRCDRFLRRNMLKKLTNPA